MPAFPADPNTIPAAPPPAGQHSQLQDPPSDNAPFIVWLILFIALSTPWVVVRMYTRQFVTRKLWWDDWTCVVGYLFMVGLVGMEFQALHLGGGLNNWDVSKAEEKQFKKIFKDQEIVARVGIFFTKASIVLLFQRLFIPPGTRWTPIWWAIWFTFWWNLLYAVALVLTVLLECVGKEQLKAEGKTCVDEFAVLICASVINVVTDLFILGIPIAAIKGLHMSWNRKLKWCGAFAVGGLGVLASLARLIYQIIYAENQTNKVIMVVSLLATAEQFVGVIVPCLAVLPAFWRHLRSSDESRDSNSGGPHLGSPWLGGTRKSRSQVVLGKKGNKDPYPIWSTAGHEESGEVTGHGGQHEGDNIMLVPPYGGGETVGRAL